MLRFKFGLVWRTGSDTCLRVAVQMVSRVEGNGQLVPAPAGGLLHQFGSGDSKTIVRNSQSMGLAQACGKPLMEFLSNGIGRR